MRSDTALRCALLGLPLSGLAVLSTTWWRGDFLQPGEVGFAAWTQTTGFAAWASASLNGTVWALFGILALYALEGKGRRAAAWGTFLFALAMAVWLPILGIVAIVWPTIDEAASVAIQNHRTFQVWGVFATSSYVLGVAAWAWALKARRLEAVTFGAGALLLAYPALIWLELLGAALYTVGTSLIAWRLWATRPKATPQPPQPSE